MELGRYVCEVSTGQYWRVEKLKSFDEFLARRFSESRQAYYFMSVQEHLPPQARKELKEELAAQGASILSDEKYDRDILEQSARWRNTRVKGRSPAKAEGRSAALGPVPPRIVAIECVASTLVLGLWNGLRR